MSIENKLQISGVYDNQGDQPIILLSKGLEGAVSGAKISGVVSVSVPESAGVTGQVRQNSVVDSSAYIIERLADDSGWRTQNVVMHDGRLVSCDFSSKLLCPMTQDELANYTVEARKKNGYGGCSLPDFYDLLRSDFLNKDGVYKAIIDEKRFFLRDALRYHWVNTLSRACYKAKDIGCVVHGYGLPECKTVNANIAGNSEWIRNVKDPRIYKALFGTDNNTEINEVFKWVTGCDSFLWRLNEVEVTEDIERVVALGIDYYDGFYLGAVNDLGIRRPAFGVRVVAPQKSVA